MKTSSDPRHLKRQEALKVIFAWDFQNKTQKNPKVTNDLALSVIDNVTIIDKLIVSAAPAWPIDQISKVDLAILRLGIYELTIEKKEPIKVIIDEAVELAKEFGHESSKSFINGVLGKLVKNDRPI